MILNNMPETAIIRNGRFECHFNTLVRVVTAMQTDEVIPALQEVEFSVNKYNRYAAGLISYEAAAAYRFDVHNSMPGLPLFWFGLFFWFGLYETVEYINTQVSNIGSLPSTL